MWFLGVDRFLGRIDGEDELNPVEAVQKLKFGFDFSDAHVEALKDGMIDVMLVQDPFRIGYEAVKSLAEKLRGRTPERRLDLPARVIVKRDLDKPEVQALLFPDWLKAK